MNCPNCGETKRIRQHDKFCWRCGCNLKLAEIKSISKKNISICKVDSRSLLKIGNEHVEVSNYNFKSSADGSTELSVVIKWESNEVELSASLK